MINTPKEAQDTANLRFLMGQIHQEDIPTVKKCSNLE